MGASIAFHLAARGAKDVVLFERDTICSGPTRHSTAVIRLHYTQALLVQMAMHGLRTYTAFEPITGSPSGFVRTGMLFGALPADRARLEENVALGQRLGVSTSVVSTDDVREIDPRVVADDLVFCHEPDAGHCDPYLVTSGFARAAARLGARVEERVRVRSVHDWGVNTDRGEIRAETVVVAAGPWTRPLLEPTGFQPPITAARAEVGRYRLPPGFGPPPPAVADFSAAQVYFRPGEADVLEVGSLDPRHSEEAIDPDSAPEGAERETLRAYGDAIARRLRGANGGHFRGTWSGVYDVTPDWEPLIGRVPGLASAVVAAGFSGHGFKLAPAVGVAVTELVLDGASTTFDLGLLDPGRFERGELVGARYGYSVLG